MYSYKKSIMALLMIASLGSTAQGMNNREEIQFKVVVKANALNVPEFNGLQYRDSDTDFFLPIITGVLSGAWYAAQPDGLSLLFAWILGNIIKGGFIYGDSDTNPRVEAMDQYDTVATCAAFIAYHLAAKGAVPAAR